MSLPPRRSPTATPRARPAPPTLILACPECVAAIHLEHVLDARCDGTLVEDPDAVIARAVAAIRLHLRVGCPATDPT